MIEKEKIFESKRKVKYLFQEAINNNNDKLIIVFSAFSPIGKPPAYNYVRTLEKIDCNKLFILDDFGARASYYLHEGQDISIEESVIELIESIIKSKNIKRENIIACGSSKGGFTSLYYGIKYKFGHVIAGSPQIFIVDYLKRVGELEVLNFILQDTNEEELNNKLVNEVKKAPFLPSFFIHLGKEEYHYKEHVKPFVGLLDQKGIKYTLDLGDYSSHSDVMYYFPELLKCNVARLTDSLYIKNVICEQGLSTTAGNELTFKADVIGDDIKYAWYVYKEKEIILKSRYDEQNFFRWIPEHKGKYRIRAFIKNNKGNIIAKSTDELIIS